jgi:uncharacterized protein YbjT (DUF2867 family)
MERRPAPSPSWGAEVVKADTSDPVSLEHAFDGVHGVFSVQNHHLSGYEEEVWQGRQVAEVAKRMSVASSSRTEPAQASRAAALGPGRPSSRWQRTSGPLIFP